MALFQSPLCTSIEADPAGELSRQLRLQEIAQLRHLNDSSGSPTGRHSSICTQVIWILFWFMVLLVIAYPVAILSGLLYALLNPLNMIECCKPGLDVLMAGLNLPLKCAQNVAEAKQLIIM